MEPGHLRHLISVQRKDETNTNGEITTTWTEIATAWASLEPIRGNELFYAQQHYGEVTHRIMLRYETRLSNLDAKHRISFGSRTFDLVAVQKIEERNVQYLVFAKERFQ